MGDLLGANVKALQNRVCLEYASTVGRFRPYDIERNYHSCKVIDTASSYTLLTPSTVKGFVGCDHAFAVFTIIGQKPVKKRQGLNQSHSLLVTIKCEYINNKNRVTRYLFQAVADHNVSKEGYFYQIHVNTDGSLLLLVSTSTTYVVRLPTEIAEDSIVADESTQVFLYANITRAEILLNKRGTPRTVVKVEFHTQYNNTICMMTMEPKSDTKHDVEQQSNENSYDATLEPLEVQGPQHAKGAHKDNKLAKETQLEMQGVIRIFNVEESIDRPYMEIHLTEPFCRTGDEHAGDNLGVAPQGTLVDFYWNTRDQSTWGGSTLFVMSNYGFVFAYCPILLPKCLSTFKRKKNIVMAAAELLKNGYYMKTDEDNKNIASENDITRLIGSIVSISHDQEKHCDEYADPVRIVPHVFKLESKHDRQNHRFEALTVLRTQPDIVMVAAGFNGAIMLFKNETALLPRTSHFKRHADECKPIYMHCSGTTRTRLTHSATRITFLTISDDTCIAHSVVETDVITIRNSTMQMKHIAQARMADNHIFYQTQPIIVAGSGEKYTHEAFRDYWDDAKRNVYILQATCCYLKAQEDLKHLATTIMPMPCRAEVERRPKGEINALQLQYGGIMARPIVGRAIANTSEAPRNKAIEEAVQKLQKYTKETEQASENAFRTARQLVGKNVKYKEKTTEMVKTISSIDSNVVLYLKTRKVFEAEVMQSLQVYQGIIQNAQKILETIPGYTNRLYEMKQRVERLKQQNYDIMHKEQRILDMREELQNLKTRENAATRVADLITNIYLRSSQKMSRGIACKVAREDKVYNYKDCVKSVVDQWLAETLKKNIENMEKAFIRMQKIRNRIVQLE